MKKIYQAPETYIFEKMVVASPLAASGEPKSDSDRQVDGNPKTESNFQSAPKALHNSTLHSPLSTLHSPHHPSRCHLCLFVVC